MSMVWVVCGAGRGVGKTTVALKLCEILPSSVYAKCGHGRPRGDKPDNFFRNVGEMAAFVDAAGRSKKHIVIESNVLALAGSPDVTVFLDGVPGRTRFRGDTDALRAAADLRVCPDVRGGDWKKALHARLTSKKLRDEVCEVLAAQQRWLYGLRPGVAVKVWLEAAGAHVFGSGLADLLDQIARSGTLQEAAKALNMSYRYAWTLIGVAEEHLGRPLILRHAGGAHGGSSALSDEGTRLLCVFRQLNRDVAEYANQRFSELYNRETVHA